MVGNGQRVPNEGELHLNMEADGVPLQSVFQVAEITRPLMSVGRVCDQGLTAKFDKEKADLEHSRRATAETTPGPSVSRRTQWSHTGGATSLASLDASVER